jgi:microcystin-dependent protein
MSNPFLAEIKIISWNFAPKGWAFCNGQFLPINQNQALFSLLGTTYGGNGQTTFALPDFRGCSPFHVGNGLSLGQKGGEAAHTLNLNEMPAHIHMVNASSNPGTLVPPATGGATPQQNIWAASTQSPYTATLTNAAGMDPGSISNVGGGQPHNNLQPYLVLNFIIALQGIFPSQN